MITEGDRQKSGEMQGIFLRIFLLHCFKECEERFSLRLIHLVYAAHNRVIRKKVFGFIIEEILQRDVESRADLIKSFHGGSLVAEFNVPDMALGEAGQSGKSVDRNALFLPKFGYPFANSIVGRISMHNNDLLSFSVLYENIRNEKITPQL